MSDLLKFHVDILSDTTDWPTEGSQSDMGQLFSDLVPTRTMSPRKASSRNSAPIHSNGWADVSWLCGVGFGCVCEEDCR